MANPVASLFGVGGGKKGEVVEKKFQKDSTLGFLQAAEIREDVVILKEGQMRMVLGVSSANFALKSVQEQDIIINTFQGVLNSLEFPIQIVMQSRKIDLTEYISKLKTLEEAQQNDLLRIKMQEYIEYIQQMISQINIMNKEFYIVVGYESIEIKEGVFNSFMRSLNPVKYIKASEEKFRKHKSLLVARTEQVAAKFRQLDLVVNTLNTESLISIMYNSYNPDTLESIRLNNIGDLDLN